MTIQGLRRQSKLEIGMVIRLHQQKHHSVPEPKSTQKMCSTPTQKLSHMEFNKTGSSSS